MGFTRRWRSHSWGCDSGEAGVLKWIQHAPQLAGGKVGGPTEALDPSSSPRLPPLCRLLVQPVPGIRGFLEVIPGCLAPQSPPEPLPRQPLHCACFQAFMPGNALSLVTFSSIQATSNSSHLSQKGFSHPSLTPVASGTSFSSCEAQLPFQSPHYATGSFEKGPSQTMERAPCFCDFKSMFLTVISWYFVLFPHFIHEAPEAQRGQGPGSRAHSW